MMKLKRILAWVIDWNLSGLPAILYALIFRELAKGERIPALGALLFAVMVLSFPALFVFRDVLLGGRSIAKRIFGLYVIDVGTGEVPSKAKMILRNLFFFIYPVEFILLLATNRSLGDITTNTTVTGKSDASGAS